MINWHDMAVFYAERLDMEKHQTKYTILGDSVESATIAKSLPFVPNIIAEIPVFTDLAIKDFNVTGATRKKIYWNGLKD